MSDALYRWQNPDDELLPLTQCACGATYSAWSLNLSVYAEDPLEMPCCGRRLYWSQQITIHEAPADDQKKGGLADVRATNDGQVGR